MKYEQIEKAARDLCTSDRQEQWLKDFGMACFTDGARWRIEAAWHDRTDTPSGFALVLSEQFDGTYGFRQEKFIKFFCIWRYEGNNCLFRQRRCR